jgi:hypothetical protein
LWRCREPGTYHVEYGYSCMGYEIAGGLGAKLAMPESEVWVLVGDGSYLMMNSEIATSITLGKKLNIVVLDNGGFGCIDRLQRACGSASFNNLLLGGSGVDFAAHAASLGADTYKVAGLADLESALPEMRAARRTSVAASRPIRLSAPASVAPGGTWPSPRYPAGPKLLRLVLPMTPSEVDARLRINQRICSTYIPDVVTAWPMAIKAAPSRHRARGRDSRLTTCAIYQALSLGKSRFG